MSTTDLRGKVASRRQQTEAGGPQNGNGNGEVVKPQDSVRALLDSMSAEFASALPTMIPLDHFMRVSLTGLKTTYGLAECSRASLFSALLKCATAGLLPCTNEAAIIPFKGDATFVPQYQGYIEIFHRTGNVARVELDWIYEADRWEYVKGDGAVFRHWPNLEAEDRGVQKLAYAFLRYKDGTRSDVVILSRKQAEHIRDNYSKSFQKAEREKKHDSPWHTNFGDQWLKGLALNTPIPTPSGWTTMEHLRVGDRVLDRSGQPTQVIAVSETKHLPCYRVNFTSGTPIICDSEHLWVAKIGHPGNRDVARRPERVHPIKDLYEAKGSDRSVVMPLAKPLDLPAVHLPVDPWLLGFWLGDGTHTRASVTCHSDEACEVVAAIQSAGYAVGAVTPDARSLAVSVGIRGLAKHLAELGVLGSKHVPPLYLRASTEQRLALLRGLMDSDGTIWRRGETPGRARFYNTSRQLADSVAELARSLGERVLQVEYDSNGFGKSVHVHQVSWTPTMMPFALSQKTARMRLRVKASAGHQVKSIELTESVPTRCIAVDSPSHTYLAGEAMIPTHNTCIRRLSKYVPKTAALRVLLDNDERDDGTDQSSPAVHVPATVQAKAEVIRDEPPAGTSRDRGEGPAGVDSERPLDTETGSSWPPVPPDEDAG